MFFFPLQAYADMQKRPWLTMAVCAICFLVYCWQETSRETYAQQCEKFIEPFTANEKILLHNLNLEGKKPDCITYEVISHFVNPYNYSKQFIDEELIKNDIAEISGFTAQQAWKTLQLQTDVFERIGYRSVDFRLSYFSGSWNIFQMLSSVFAHANRSHLFFNLVFFWAFGCVLELVIGARLMCFLFLATAVVESISVSYAYSNPCRSIGLSGVCMCMMGALFAIHPTAKIRTFIWILSLVKIVPVPLYWFALWYIGWDIFDLLKAAPDDSTNHSAHLSGALVGAVFGYVYRMGLTKEQAQAKPLVFYD